MKQKSCITKCYKVFFVFSPSDKPFIGLSGMTCRLIAWAQVQEPLSGLSLRARHLTPDCSHVASPAIGVSRKEKYKRKKQSPSLTTTSYPGLSHFTASLLQLPSFRHTSICQTSPRAHPKMLLLDLFLTSGNSLPLHLCSGLYTVAASISEARLILLLMPWPLSPALQIQYKSLMSWQL